MIKKYHIELLITVNIVLMIGLYSLCIYSYYEQKKIEVEKEIVFPQSSKELINDNTELEKENKKSISNTKTYAEIKGAVKNPGVYAITDATIINDLINMSGGLNKNAYTNNINLSKKVTDEMVIYVYTKEEYKKQNNADTKIVTVVEECNCPTYDIGSCIEDKNSIINSEEESQSKDVSEQDEQMSTKININTASKEELMSLSGIGEAKANSIIEYRKTNGNFSKTEDIINVSGISENIYEKIKELITV